MKTDQDTEIRELQSLKEVRFSPTGDDSTFLTGIKTKVRKRSRQRAAMTTSFSALGAIVLLVAVLNVPALLRSGINMDVLRNPELVDIPSYNSETDLDNELSSLFGEYGMTSDTDDIGSDLATLFDLDAGSDPVSILAEYDSEVQDDLLARLKDLDILGTSDRLGASERGES